MGQHPLSCQNFPTLRALGVEEGLWSVSPWSGWVTALWVLLVLFKKINKNECSTGKCRPGRGGRATSQGFH